MISNSSTISVAELIEKQVLFIGDGYRAKNSEFDIAGIPFARISNISDNGEIDLSSADLLPENALHKVGNKISQPGDIVFTSKGSVGRFIFVKADTPQFVYSPQLSFWRVLDDKLVVQRFLIYWMQGTEFQQQIHGLKSQTDMADYVSLSDQRRMMITLPPFPIQRRIAEILGRLDDKIEVNRRINRTLEAMAGALYKHWFVDFGPFQDGEFVESALGLIPQGWRVGEMEDLFLLQRGFDLPAPARTPGKYPVMAASGFNGNHAECKVQGPGVVTGRSGVLGKVFYVPDDFWPLNTTLWIRAFRVSRPLHAYHFLQNFDLLSFNSGSAVPTLNRNDIHHIHVIVPTPEVVALFEKKVGNWFALIHQNEQEMQKLTEIRDYLLPKLLSGEIPVGAATEQVDDATENQPQ